MPALKSLIPSKAFACYPDWYYLGPFAKISDPDRDLPRRTTKITDEDEDEEYVAVRDMDGQHCIPPFRDSNELGDINGLLLITYDYPNWEDWMRFSYPTIQGCLLKAADRIRAKITRNKNPARGEYFAEALGLVYVAADAYFTGDHKTGQTSAMEAYNLLQEGNRLRKQRRKAQPEHGA